MIILKSVILENFLSHSFSTIDFDENVKMAITGVSGSGKSSIVEAILWCLFGRGRTDNRSLIKRGAKSATVALELADGSTLYRITRIVSEKGKQTLNLEKKMDIIGYEPVSKTGLKDAQEYIEKELLHSSYLLFINSVIYPQDNTESFVKQTAVKRKELLLEIVGAENYEFYYTRAKSLANVTGEGITRRSGELKNLNEQKEENVLLSNNLMDYQLIDARLKEDLKSIENEATVFLASISKLQEAQSKSGMLSFGIDAKKTEIEKLKKRKDDIFYSMNEIAFPQLSELDIDLKLSEQEELIKEKNIIIETERLETSRKGQLMAIMANKPNEIDYEKEIEGLQKQITSIASGTNTYCKEINRDCPTLLQSVENQTKYYTDQIESKKRAIGLQAVSFTEYAKKLETIGPEIVFDSNRLKFLQVTIPTYDKYAREKERMATLEQMKIKQKQELEIIETDIMVAEMRLDELYQELKQLSMSMINLTDGVSDGRDYAGEIRQKNADITSNSFKLMTATTATKKLEEIESKLKDLNELHKEETEKLESLLLVKEAFGSTGIKSVVVDYILPGLEEKINEVLSKLSTFSITLDTQKKTVTGESTIEGLFINLFDAQNNMSDYDSYSGGEKNRIAYAIFEGLASIQKCNFRIFDESIAGLDEETISSFAEVMLQMRNDENRQILCVSHIQSIQDIFETSINVINNNGNSKII